MSQARHHSWQSILTQEMQGSEGFLTFHRFMELALYHPDHGYYMGDQARIGRGGDFVTAPEITSLFGELLTLQLVEIWELLDSPDPFTVVEVGGGTGQLAVDVLTTARRFPQFMASLIYVLVEKSPDFVLRQQELCTRHGFGAEIISWRTDLPDEVEAGVIFGNEFLDALPVHWVEMGDSGLQEVVVGWSADESALTQQLIASQPPLQSDYFADIGIELPVGYRTEVGLDAQAWMTKAGQVLRRGVLLMIDYGYPATEYYVQTRDMGTLVGHRGHERLDDPLQFPGEMDLTAHIDFSAMARAGERGGLEMLGFTTQGWFLLGLGILERLEQSTAKMTQERGRSLRESVMRLLMPHEMGERFKVLAMGRDMKACGLSGFRLNDQRQRL